MTTQPEALRLADELDWRHKVDPINIKAATEMRRLHEEVEELDALRERLADLLSRTAVALKGPEPPLTRWDWSDLPERALSLRAVNQELLEALKGLMPIAEWDGGRFDANTIGDAAMPEFAAARVAIAKATEIGKGMRL
jgi:hypothetical protein